MALMHRIVEDSPVVESPGYLGLINNYQEEHYTGSKLGNNTLS